MGDLLGSYSGCVRVRTKHAGKDSWWFVRPVITPMSSSGGTPGPGTIAACFAFTNWFARPMGGEFSDRMAKRFGIRGRLWGLWVVQTVAGLMCVLLGRLDSLGASIAVMCIFSVLVQASSGLVFGVVPFVSKRSLGVISGMTGSGGTLGAVVTQTLLFSGSKFSTQTSISLMGLMMIVCTLPVSLIYFPQWGGMFCRPYSLDESSADEDYRLLV
ncbi:hypothetical protein PTKIN_Ptkin08bG0029700 [Pterospermum kingtungense]